MKKVLLLASVAGASLLALTGSASAACVAPYCPAPSAVTGAVSAVTDTTATLSGAVNPNGSGPTSWRIELSAPNTSTFSTVVASGTVPDGTAAVPVSGAAAGLSPGASYAFRVTATSLSGSVFGAPATFATLTSAPSGGGTTGGGTSGGEPSTGPIDPDGVAIKARTRRDRRAPYSYVFHGKVLVGDQSLCSAGNGGNVIVRLSRGQTIGSETTGLKANCTYRARVTVSRSDVNRRSRGRINVRARFGGNAGLNAMSSRTIKIRFG